MTPRSAAELFADSEAAYAAGRLEETLELLERSHSVAMGAADTIAAAQAAVRLAMHFILDTGLMAPVRAWTKRAERLLQGRDETPLHAWLGVARACERWLS